jgi:hypothetical protein
MIRDLESASPFACPLCVEAGQGGADQHEEEARCSVDCAFRFRAQLTFNFLLNPLLLPTADRRICAAQQFVFMGATQTCLAFSSTSGLFKMPSQPWHGSAGSGCRVAIVHCLWEG